MLLIFGFGYTGRAIAKAANRAGFEVCATSRTPDSLAPEAGVTVIPFEMAEIAIRNASHIVATAAPDAAGDPVLARYAEQISAAPELRWIGYLSTTGVYGNRDGGWVDEDSDPAAQSARAQRRVQAVAAGWTRRRRRTRNRHAPNAGCRPRRIGGRMTADARSIFFAWPEFMAQGARCSMICGRGPQGAW